MPTRRFGPYEVLARLATGGAANIFLARKPSTSGLRTLSVLKTLLPERASDQEFVDMFLDEARLAARLSHPACVEIHELGKEGGTFYISMEYIIGETLWGLLASVPETRQPLPPLVVASIIATACEGLHHAHELTDDDGQPYNLVHRDVSPQNIMVSYDGQTKLLDFGIAKAETGRAATATGIVKGKFSYMSPEQITGGNVDRRSDIYSLGIVLFECLAARRLYRAETPEDIARLMLERRPPRLREILPDVDPALDAICAKALARHPQHRYATAREMADALRECLHAHRFVDGPVPVQRLVEERFGARIHERRRILERATVGPVEETELLRVLGARVVMDVDLYSFPAHENTSNPDPRSLSALDTQLPGGEPAGAGHSSLDRRGVRVELRSTGTPPETIELSDRAARLNGDDEGPPTRLDGDSTVLEGLEDGPPAPSRLLEPREPRGPVEGSGVEEIDTRRFDVNETLGGIDDVPIAQRRKKDGVRSDPRAPTRALASRRPGAPTEAKVEVVRPAAKPTVGRGEAPEPARGAVEPRFASSGLTSPVMPSGTDALGMGMVQEPPRLVEESSVSGPVANFAVPEFSLTPQAGLPQPGPSVRPVSSVPPALLRGERSQDRAHDRAERSQDRAERSQDRAERSQDRSPDRAERSQDRSPDRAERSQDRAERSQDRAERSQDRAERSQDRAHDRPGDPPLVSAVTPTPLAPDSGLVRAAPAPLSAPPLVEPLSVPYDQASGEAQTYSLGVVLAALAFGVTLGLLLGVLVSLFTR